ncbi:MAG: hypothetical protein J5654_05225 [Victivallales bacterium]|nr:hypothetical protein [Victivallales bacterium]
MNNRSRLVFILVATLLWFEVAVIGGEVDRSLSNKRLATLEKLMDEALSAKPEMDLNGLLQATSETFKATEKCLQATTRPPLVLEPESEAKADEALAAAALEVYPAYSMPELRQKAAEVYPLYKLNQTVTVIYKKTPRLTEKVRGIYMGTRGGNIIISSHTIRLGDMEGIEGNDGPEGEIVKFDQIANQRYREQWMDEYISNSAVARKKYEDEHRTEFVERQFAEDFLANQNNGYTYWEEQWFTPDALLREYAANAIAVAARVSKAREADRVNRANAEIASQVSMASQSYAVNPVGKLPRVEGVLAKQAEAERKRQELAEQQAREEEAIREREEEEARQAELEAERQAAASRPTPSRQEPQVEPPARRSRLWLYIVVIVVLVGIVGLVVWMFFFRGEKELDVSDFYKSKGAFQENFWKAAESDPDHFKYVAYLFDTVDEAKNALCQLSFVGLGVNGELKSKRGDIILGAYSHHDRAVAVVGGVSLNYARWREASMIWPELPHASYFRQSSEPKVKLVMPSAEELSRQEGLSIEKLGEEDVRTESGEINRVFRYRCANREEALKFLALFKVEEEGVVVRVETAEGEFGKDINGVFTL